MPLYKITACVIVFQNEINPIRHWKFREDGGVLKENAMNNFGIAHFSLFVVHAYE